MTKYTGCKIRAGVRRVNCSLRIKVNGYFGFLRCQSSDANIDIITNFVYIVKNIFCTQWVRVKQVAVLFPCKFLPTSDIVNLIYFFDAVLTIDLWGVPFLCTLLIYNEAELVTDC